jgi:hypothetical protein
MRRALTPAATVGAVVMLTVAAGCASSSTTAGSSTAGSSTSAGSSMTGSSSSSLPAVASSSGGPIVSQEIFDRRYCEVVVVNTEDGTTTQIVYNTLGLNNCPQDQWSALTPEIAAQEFGSQSAELNGPRHWLLDNIQQNTAPQPPVGVPQTFTFGGIDTAVRAKIEVPSGTAAVGSQAYTPNPVQRDTIWIYNQDRTLYELVDPDGNVYVMQSYSQQIDPTLDLRSLDTLGSKLGLPTGWSFKTEKTTDEVNLVSGGTAYVIQDDLLNSYQRRSPQDTTGPAPSGPPGTSTASTTN